jgi:enoyl-[acyl-carrier protein] reductase I
MGLLKGKKALILGVRNEHSIAYGIAKELLIEEAKISIVCQNEEIKQKTRDWIGNSIKLTRPCDVNDDDQIESLIDEIAKDWKQIDILVHSIAFANPKALKENIFCLDRKDFLESMETSVYSLIRLIGAAMNKSLLKRGSSIITMTYYGSQKVIPNYAPMGVAKGALETSVLYLANDLAEFGVRINAISAGPIMTSSASGIPEFRKLYKYADNNTPLGKISLKDIGGVAVYLASDLSCAATGSVIYADKGLNIMI